jgi:hypothetical protein
MRIADRGVFCLRAAVLAILCMLVVAASAYADEPVGVPTPPEATETQGLGEGQQGTDGGSTQEQPAQEDPKSGEEASAGSGGVTGEEPGGSTTTTGETGTESTSSTVGTGETVETVTVQTPPVTGQTPEEAINEGIAPKAGPEGVEGTSATLLHGVSLDSAAAQAADSRAVGASETAGESQTLVAGPLTPPPTAPTAGSGQAQAPATLATGGGGGPRGGMTAAQRAGALTCELSALGGRTTDNCTVGWLGGKRFLASSAVGFAPAVGSLVVAMTGTLPPGGGHGGSAVGSAPVSPVPGPAPSGASGAAVGGSSGVAPSAFLSLAGLLLLAAPLAMRRLRLSSRPWLTACFVLIPERPG